MSSRWTVRPTHLHLVLGLALATTVACQFPYPDAIDAGLVDAPVADADIDAPMTDARTMATVTVVRNGNAADNGAVTSSPTGIDCPGTCAFDFPIGSTVTLTRVVIPGVEFTGWSGVCNDALPTCSFTLEADLQVFAGFDVAQHTVTVVPAGNGSGTTTSSVGGINCPGGCSATVPYNTSMTLTAAPTGASTFAGWNDVGCNGVGPCTFTVTRDESIDVRFALDFTLTVGKNGNGHGTVTSAPGIDCGADCDQVYPAGTVVTLTAAPDPDSSFVGWSGGGCSGVGTCTVTINGVVSVTAAFDLKRYPLTVSRNGTGTGTVSSNPPGISCGTACTVEVDHGTQVILTADADASSTFTGWSEPSCTGPSCVVTITAARSVLATFAIRTYTLTFDKLGEGLGTVSSNPAGISCGTACTTTQLATFNHGQTVTLSQAAGADSQFVSWGGDCAGASCSVLMTADHVVTATFQRIDKTLTVTVAGTGTGSVTSMPAGINAPGDNTEAFAHGTSVVLTASWNNATNTFTGWSGGSCSGSTNPCAVTMDQARTVVATFDVRTVTLTVVRDGVGTGTVASIPAGIINCGVDCTEVINSGSMVTLRATPTAGDVFYGWSGGGCTGSGDCTTTLSSSTTVTATFDNCVRSTETCSAATYTSCGADGDFVSHTVPNGGANGESLVLTMQNYACPMQACHATQPRCADIDASNTFNTALDASQTSADGLDVELTMGAANVTIDTGNYNAAAGTTTITRADGSTLVVPAAIITQPANPPNAPAGPDVLVLKVRTFSVRPGAYVEVRGTRALGIVSHFDVFVAGTLDLSANANLPGAGHSTYPQCAGSQNATATGGAGNIDTGGSSSAGASGGQLTYGGYLQPIQGGCAGGSVVVSAANTVRGGQGGGSLQVVSRRRVAIAGTGSVNVSGGGGVAAIDTVLFQGRASGGGSGGGVLVEAPTVQFASGSAIAGRGGSGAAATQSGTLASGVEGPATGSAGAPSTMCTNCGVGGAGGSESATPGSGTGGSAAQLGGGGGAVGRCYVRNTSGSLSPPAGTMKIRFQALALSPPRSP